MKRLTIARLLLVMGAVLILSAPLFAYAIDAGTGVTASNRAITPIDPNQLMYPSYPTYPAQPLSTMDNCGQYQPAPVYPTQPSAPMDNCWQYPPQYAPQPSWGSPKALYQSGLQLVRAKRYQEAIQTFARFLQYYPNSDLADNALYWTGESFYALKMYPRAISYFQQIQYRYPRGNKVPDSLLKGALAYFAMNQTQQGCMFLNQLESRFPNSESARKAKRYAGRCQSGGGSWYSPNPCGTYQGYQQPSYQPYYGGSDCQTPYQPNYGYGNY